MSTIHDVENRLQTGLEALRDLPLNSQIMEALRYILPDGYSPIVQLEEDGRKKRSTADASNWQPETGEIRIYFEKRPVHVSQPTLKSFASPPAKRPTTMPASSSTPLANPAASRPFGPLPVSPTEMTECCQALAEAEKIGRQFIALKWFRDDFLIKQGFVWASSDSRRQQVLAHAIEHGRIDSRKIPNPRSPQFPTTIITLNRSNASPGVPPRFEPVSVRGESVSSSLLRDRGAF